MKIQVKQPRRLQALELYSQDFYEDVIKPAVDTEVKEQGVVPKNKITTIRRCMKDAFDAEDETVKQKYIDAAQAQPKKTVGTEPDMSPEGYSS